MTTFFDLMRNVVNTLNVAVRAIDKTVSFEKQELTDAQKAQVRANIGVDNGSGGSTEGAVLYTAQNLSDAQKAQARKNIDAPSNKEIVKTVNGTAPDENGNVVVSGSGGGSAEGTVLYTAQELTEEQKTQARKNIGVDSALLLTEGETIVVSDNLYNQGEAVSGGYYRWDDGNWVERSDIASTGFIECKAGDTIYQIEYTYQNRFGGNVTFYDNTKTFISGMNVVSPTGNAPTFTVPNNSTIKYFRMSFQSWALEINQINKGSLKSYDVYMESTKITYASEYDISSPNIKKLEEANRLLFTQTYQDITVLNKRSVRYGTSYWITIINREKFDGGNTSPIVVGTDPASPLGGTGVTNAVTFAKNNDYLHVVNGGIFLDDENVADGILIVNGQIIQDTGVTQFGTEQYVLGIDSSGDFKTYRNATASEILADGTMYALTAFVPLIVDGQNVGSDVLNICPHSTVKHPRQIIGTLSDGNYFTFACDGRTENEEGMTLSECISTLNADLNVKFAYNLDGGGSTQSIVGKKQINRIIDNRKIPNVIAFI